MDMELYGNLYLNVNPFWMGKYFESIMLNMKVSPELFGAWPKIKANNKIMWLNYFTIFISSGKVNIEEIINVFGIFIDLYIHLISAFMLE